MSTVHLTIDGSPVQVPAGSSILAAARALGIDIPTLCYLEKCGPLNTCQVCLVKLNCKLVPSCGTIAEPGMIVQSDTQEVHEARRTALELLFSDHVGDCLSPCHRLCPLGLNIPVMLRQIQSGDVAHASATMRGALPLAGVLGRLCHHPCEQGCRRGNWDDPAAIRDLERFVADWEARTDAGGAPSLPACKPRSGKRVTIIGSGPTGLMAAYHLLRNGHAVVALDRRAAAGGALREVDPVQLPPEVLERELAILATLGLELRLGAECGLEDLLGELARGSDAVLVACGELDAAGAEKLGLPWGGSGLVADPNTCLTPAKGIFAAGAAVRPVKHLVRAMAEGRAAAEAVHRFLIGQDPRRPEKAFSSLMGRLNPGELKQFLAIANTGGSVMPCDRCAGFSHQEAAAEAARCLHCDCRSSGQCVLQHYGQTYGVDANRFRSERREFKQEFHPGGVIFEPGKCILCGICVKLTELAGEPIGLALTDRGFNVRVAAPFHADINAGMQKVAEECVRHCPTGALAFGEARR